MRTPDEVPKTTGAADSGGVSSARRVARVDDGAAALLSLLMTVPLLAYRVILLLKPLPLQDFITYWSAGRLFLSGGDPYSPSATLAMEQSLRWPHPAPLVMLNPPWILPLIAPFAMVPFWPAHYFAFTLSLATEVLSSLALWRYFGGEKRRQWIAVLVLLTFLPAANAEHYGQVTPLILGALTVFLFAMRAQRFLLAGSMLAIFALKPHLLYLVLLAILLWSIQNRKWMIPISAAVCAAAATLGSIAFNHKVLGYFSGTVHAALISPCGIGGYLRSVFGWQHIWLQFLPCVVGLGWFAAYWMRHRRAWTWEERMPLLLLVSIGSAAYFWKHDFIVGLPAVTALAIQVARARVWLVTAFLYLAIQLAILAANETVHECVLSLLWIALYWLVGLLCVRSLGASKRDDSTARDAGTAIAVEG